MRVFTVICLVIVATLASGHNAGDGVIGSRKVLRLSLDNPGDVFLVGNFLACLNAYSCMSKAITLELDSPLGFLVQQLFIYEYDGCLVFFNKQNAKLLFMVPKAKMDEILVLVNVSADLYRLPLEVAFNAYLGINNVRVTKNCGELFNYFGNILSELLGVGCKPTAAFNLLGMLNFCTVFPPDLVVLQPYSPISRVEVQLPVDLALLVARCSIIVDAAAFYNKNFLFQDIIFPGKTASNYKIGNVLGCKDLLSSVLDLLEDLLSNLSAEEGFDFLVQLLLTITIDARSDQVYEDFFDLVAQNGHDYESTTVTDAVVSTTPSAG